MTTVRPAAVAGQFYPRDPGELRHQIEFLLGECNAPPVTGTPVALISPHAGYVYSGRTAAEGYRAIAATDPDIVVIVSPSHREYFEGISVYGGSHYETPLGRVSVERESAEALVRDDPWIISSDVGHLSEHALEVQLPFLQITLGRAGIVPIVMGDQRPEICGHLGRRLAEVFRGKKVLLVASTDLSHYHTYDEAERFDSRFSDLVARFDHERLMKELENRTVEACGGGPTVSVLGAAKSLGADTVSILHRCNSGDVTGDRSGVVGYLSAVVHRKRKDLTA